jgi:hypothetical protein
MLADRLRQDVGLHPSSFGTPQVEEWSRGVLACVHRGLCAIHGHDLFLHFEPHRLSLRCVGCGWESSGWALDRPWSCNESSDRPRADISHHSAAGTVKIVGHVHHDC